MRRELAVPTVSIDRFESPAPGSVQKLCRVLTRRAIRSDLRGDAGESARSASRNGRPDNRRRGNISRARGIRFRSVTARVFIRHPVESVRVRARPNNALVKQGGKETSQIGKQQQTRVERSTHTINRIERQRERGALTKQQIPSLPAVCKEGAP